MRKNPEVKLKKVDDLPPNFRRKKFGIYWQLGESLRETPGEWHEVEGDERARKRVYNSFSNKSVRLPGDIEDYEVAMRRGRVFVRYMGEGQHVA